MNARNSLVFPAAARGGASLPRESMRPFAWNLFAAWLCLLAAFVGMSFIAMAARLVIDGVSVGGSLELAVAGVTMLIGAWRGAAHHLRVAEQGVVARAHPTLCETHAPQSS